MAEQREQTKARIFAQDICRELYDRFAMGGWEPIDAHNWVIEQLQEFAHAPRQSEQDNRPFDKLPDAHVTYVENWLTANHKSAFEVRWSLYPIGMVQRWIERAEQAEAPRQSEQTGNYICDDEVFPQTVTFDNGRVVSLAKRADAEGYYLTISPKKEYPKPCDVCGGVIQSEGDLDWHGYGNCRDIPEAIMTAPKEPTAP